MASSLSVVTFRLTGGVITTIGSLPLNVSTNASTKRYKEKKNGATRAVGVGDGGVIHVTPPTTSRICN